MHDDHVLAPDDSEDKPEYSRRAAVNAYLSRRSDPFAPVGDPILDEYLAASRAAYDGMTPDRLRLLRSEIEAVLRETDGLTVGKIQDALRARGLNASIEEIDAAFRATE